MNPFLLAMGYTCAVWAGMAALCFQSPSQRHRMGLREQTAGERRRFIAAGAALLMMSLAMAIAAEGLSFGIVLWLCLTGVLGFALICLLPFSAVLVVRSSRSAALIAPLLLAAGSWLPFPIQ